MAESVDLKLGSQYIQPAGSPYPPSLTAGSVHSSAPHLVGGNRFIMVRDIWKLVHVPCLTFANAVCMTAATREWLERRQREVGRTALACHGRVADESVQGDLGWSCFEARKASSKLVYRGPSIHVQRALARQTSSPPHIRYTSGAPGVRDKEEELWQQAMSGKVTLELYRSSKGTIGSARAGALQTLTYKRTIDREMASVLCRACGSADETIAHLVIECGQIGLPRTESLRTALGFAGEDGETDVQAASVDAAP
ncbi:hypothetical protein HPB52_024640 [Rhipicephalus sanguineus]|uniref:Tick transposon n=1 Tax=Rhipicephalus sanguineus TaxID=34632 RepID=A0A9D4YS82_RHISA|nr:hypothetical protein HPB52_024640 [Rhipicephalus sanguineus]